MQLHLQEAAAVHFHTNPDDALQILQEQGLVSINNAFIIPRYLLLNFCADERSILSIASVICFISEGYGFEKTEITPSPPNAIIGNV